MPNHIQTKGAVSGGTVPSLTIALDGPTTTGNFLYVAVSIWDGTSPPSVTVADNKTGNSFAQVHDAVMPEDVGYRLLAFRAPNINGGSGHQVTVTPVGGGSHWMTASAGEYSQILASSPDDGAQTGDDFLGAVANAGPIVTTESGLLVAAIVRSAAWDSVTIPSGFSKRYEQKLSAENTLLVVDRPTSPAGTHTVTCTFDSTAQHHTWLVAGFKGVAPSVNLPAIAAYYRRLRGA